MILRLKTIEIIAACLQVNVANAKILARAMAILHVIAEFCAYYLVNLINKLFSAMFVVMIANKCLLLYLF